MSKLQNKLAVINIQWTVQVEDLVGINLDDELQDSLGRTGEAVIMDIVLLEKPPIELSTNAREVLNTLKGAQNGWGKSKVSVSAGSEGLSGSVQAGDPKESVFTGSRETLPELRTL